MSRSASFLRAAIAAAVFLGLDQATKQLVIHNVDRGDSINVFFGIDLTNVRNNGVAFGAFAGGGALIGILTAVALAALLVYFFLRAGTPWLWLPVGVILGGALGNLLDRIRIGAVVDFIDPSFWPAFNVADMGIVIGIFGLFYVVDRRAATKA